MSKFYIGVTRHIGSDPEKGLFLDDFRSVEEFYDKLDQLFTEASFSSPKCRICGSSTTWDNVSPKGWTCDNEMCDAEPIWSDETDRDVFFRLSTESEHADPYYNEKLLKYNLVGVSTVSPSLYVFFEVFDEIQENAVEEPFFMFLDYIGYNADTHDINEIHDHFKNNYIGFSGTFDDRGTEEWLGEWLVENEYVTIPEDLEGSVDLTALAAEYISDEKFWYKDGYVFQN